MKRYRVRLDGGIILLKTDNRKLVEVVTERLRKKGEKFKVEVLE